jgi:hypothetical protein
VYGSGVDVVNFMNDKRKVCEKVRWSGEVCQFVNEWAVEWLSSPINQDV